jgi:histidinol-phosphate phosphatase family protein
MRDDRKKIQVNQAVVLCGGFGTRLGKITLKTPKPLLKFNKIPFVDYIIQNLSRHNFEEIILLCHFKHELFVKKYHNKTILGVRIKCAVEKTPLGTFGSIKNAKTMLNDYFLLLNGDTYFNINLRDLVISYGFKNFLGIVALAQKKGRRFSKVLLSKKGLISQFDSNKKSSLINSGSYVFSKKICNIKSNKFSSLEKDILPELVRRKKLQGKKYTDKHNNFIDIGVPKDYAKVKNFLFSTILKKAAFLDRDGVINEDSGYVYKIKDFIWKKDAIRAIKYLNDKNFYVFIVTNQAGVARGYYKESDVEKLHHWVSCELNKKGAYIDEYFYSTYHESSKKKFTNKEKKLRKPDIGMIKLAISKWKVLTKKSIVIGDRETDMLMAKRANLRSYMVNERTNLLRVVKQFHNIAK